MTGWWVGFLVGFGGMAVVVVVLGAWGRRMAGGVVRDEVTRRSYLAWRAGCPKCGYKP